RRRFRTNEQGGRAVEMVCNLERHAMRTTHSLLIAAAVPVMLLAAGCKPEPAKPKVTEPKASTTASGSIIRVLRFATDRGENACDGMRLLFFHRHTSLRLPLHV